MDKNVVGKKKNRPPGGGGGGGLSRHNFFFLRSIFIKFRKPFRGAIGTWCDTPFRPGPFLEVDGRGWVGHLCAIE